MDASVLIVGNDPFPSHLLQQIPQLSSFHVDRVTTAQEAEKHIHDRPPHLVLLQASHADSLEVCRELKQNRYSAWIYCILINDQSRQQGDPVLPDFTAEARAMAEALEAGADAYLWLRPICEAEAQSSLQQQQTRLLTAQVQTGIQRAQGLRDLIRANDLLSALALSDPLTELNNRRALNWELPRQIRDARSRSMPLSVMMLDIDYFKQVNDTYGHLVGDRVLQLLAERLRSNMRFYDTPFRYGGEEFVVLLNSTNAHEALMIARRICYLVDTQLFDVNDNLSLHLTISAGTASLQPEDDEKGLSLLQRADEQLLQAKATGRNRAVSNLDLPSNS